jgi:D-galacturonate reductase
MGEKVSRVVALFQRIFYQTNNNCLRA